MSVLPTEACVFPVRTAPFKNIQSVVKNLDNERQQEDGNDAPLSFPSPEQPTKSISVAEQFKKKTPHAKQCPDCKSSYTSEVEQCKCCRFKFKAPSTTVIGAAATAATRSASSASFGTPSTTFGASSTTVAVAAAAAATMSGSYCSSASFSFEAPSTTVTGAVTTFSFGAPSGSPTPVSFGATTSDSTFTTMGTEKENRPASSNSTQEMIYTDSDVSVFDEMDGFFRYECKDGSNQCVGEKPASEKSSIISRKISNTNRFA
eukprot:CAMPEP_0113501764 /NCGR_PEP_ID=MMETSP0014_2-20120614/33145_1 /TAXON_ID=2857 /ORGANISM="Nitzschia sp." /LENGTH=260 /DNA_ID=CAMNT_0000396407 /DNA_START=87 /DNA_END=866 /DNA_ORIENTATION=+ /assembly_acc=CAM_ASM_000159